MSGYREAVLECQGCGEVLRQLTPAEAQQVALRPYDFVVFCRQCRPHAVQEHLR